MEEVSSRRPLKLRSNSLAKRLATGLSKSGITPNVISALSVVAAGLGGFSFVAAGEGWIAWPIGWVTGAICIQARLLCNLMDGMVAIEGGKKSSTGDLWNEVPDRIADPLLLISASIAVGLPWLGVLAAWAAVMTSYVRSLGASLTGLHDFCGPFAKQQRMAVLSFAALVTAADSLWNHHGQIMRAAMIVITVGTLFTVIRRLARLGAKLSPPSP